MEFKELLKQNTVLLDGAMGTMLQNAGLEAGAAPEFLNLKNPGLIEDIHKKYIDAGAQIVYANTFGANRYKLKGESVEKVVGKGIEIAKKACGNRALTALDIGPIGQLLEPSGTLKFEDAYDIFKEQIIAGRDADVIVFETMTDLYELKAAVLAAKENSDKPVICTMTFEENGRTFTGCCISSMALVLNGLGVDALGINCSLGPDQLLPLCTELLKYTDLPVVLKPNAGLPDPITGEYDITPEEFGLQMRTAAKKGVKIFGGCCGTTPEYISVLKTALDGVRCDRVESEKKAAVCTPSRTVFIDQPRIIGERINPTGKKLFKEALKKNDIGYILNQAIEQIHAGADILDVNVGLPEIDEKQMMINAVKQIQSVTDVPLQIDSTIPEVLEEALRVYNGKPIVNSVNGEEKSLDTVLPLVKKYGAAVVGLTLDQNGIPKKAEQRFAIARRILERAIEYGIPKEDIFIDCLTLTASAEQEAVMETLEALRRVKKELGLKTVLGVSNISFGLPNRPLVNHTFLTMALSFGLDLPIINPNIDAMTGVIRAFKLLKNIDKNSVDFIAAYNDTAAKPEVKTQESMTLDYAVENGLKEESAKATFELLKEREPMEIVNGILIPALDRAGDRFEKGTIFLPQLILTAGAAQAAFGVIREKMMSENSSPVSKGKIVLATVKGDIHDIGKNIVKVLLENYGYTVIDLGKDVPCESVVQAAAEQDVKLVGLSALMTTTLKAMEDTITLLRENGLKCKVVVGGAVLTPEYAKKIGADFYAKDAKETCDIAKSIYG
ncbi:MAG: homocysteine S-methyltransferase family protein [Clostridium sp.]|nr:homocysteine S-methyltransferase family protein [Clostridium sp.]MCM1546754.1 homocysteine S-methyltransferase family protein [Ruminococcus sp.]